MKPPRDSFLGTGWKFPVSFEKNAGNECKNRMSKAEQDIAESLTILFTTRPGERVMRPNYGASLEDLVFEPANVSLLAYIEELIRQSILYYEPRIELLHIKLDSSQYMEGVILIDLVIKVRSTNNRFNYVYDYYRREATITPLT
jgi:hypothetical protein